MSNLIACRIASYGRFAQRAWSHLPELGVFHVEILVPSPEEVGAVKGRLAAHGLSASSCQVECDVQSAGAVEQIRPQLAVCAELGATIGFVSMHAGQADRSAVIDRLRAIGDAAGALGVTVALETHPDLAGNGAVAAETMAAVDHPHVGINFDTANVHYYNHGVTSEGELGKVIDRVASVHLKDTDGGYESWNFPTLGRGVVDFPAVFSLLHDRGFAGPCTVELEGAEGVELDEAGQLEHVTDSFAYLRRIGALE